MKWGLYSLGMLYADQGKLAEAEAIYIRALQGNEEALGPKHILTLETVNNLGNLYKNQGKSAEAEAMFTRALQGKEEALGPMHTSILDTINNLGNLYRNQGKPAEAEAMFTWVLQGKEEVPTQDGPIPNGDSGYGSLEGSLPAESKVAFSLDSWPDLFKAGKLLNEDDSSDI